MRPVLLLSALLCFATNGRLRNLPAVAPYMYEPGAYFGITRPDTFWLE
jgi:hypothetical protein